MTTEEYQARLEDCRWMAATGECLDGAARRLGLSRNTLEKWLERNDPDLLEPLIRRQPRDHNKLIWQSGQRISVNKLTRKGQEKARYRQRKQARANQEAA